jgi:hypothetical protein
MKRRIYLLIFCLGLTIISYSQDSLNQLDSAGKKNGRWIVYLDKSWKEVKDTNQAYYYDYTYYDNGYNVYTMDWGKNWKLVHAGENEQQKGRLKLLNGEYSWIDSKNRTRMVINYKNGVIVSSKWAYPAGIGFGTWDYTKKWRGEAHTYRYCEYNKNGEAIYYWMHKIKPYGWGLYPGSENGN